MKPALLLIGGGVMQIPVIDYAHRLGVRVVALDGNPSAPARDSADDFFVCDIKDRDACLAVAREIQQARGLEGVITVGTDFSTTVSWIAEALGLPATPYSSAQLAKDKGLMRQRFADSGVRSPRYVVLSSCPSFPPHWEFGFPVVVKPTDNMGARGVRLVREPGELMDAIEQAFPFVVEGGVIIEEYIPGSEYSLDAIVRDGKIIRCGFADRTILFPPYFIEIGHTFPSAAPPTVQEAVWEEFEKGVRALGLSWGAAKGDVKYDPEKGAVIGEIASRLSGGYMSGWTYPLSSGRSAVWWAVETALGRPLSDQAEEIARPVVERAWIGIPGVIREITGVDAVRDLQGVHAVFISVKPGNRTVFPRNNVEKLGNLIATADTVEAAEDLARTVRNSVIFSYEPGRPETNEFLFGAEDHPWWFDQAKGVPAESWPTVARDQNWKDPYGNLLVQLIERAESLGVDLSDPRSSWFRGLIVGGLSGALFAWESR